MRWQYIVAALLVLAIVVAGCIYFFSPASDTTPEPTYIDPNPFGDPADSVPNTGTSSSDTVPVTLKDKSVVRVPNFVPEEQPAWANADVGLQIAGNEQAGSSGAGYDILYFPKESFFSISLLDEPIGEKRLIAENALRTKLRLSDAQLCSLNSEVVTSIHINETYAGRNLGFSFCSGATVLPK